MAHEFITARPTMAVLDGEDPRVVVAVLADHAEASVASVE